MRFLQEILFLEIMVFALLQLQGVKMVVKQSKVVLSIHLHHKVI
jgi:hypothetical protein